MDPNSNPAPAPAEAPATGTETTTNPASTPAENTQATAGDQQNTPPAPAPADPNAWLASAPEDVRKFFENNGGFEGVKKTVSARGAAAQQNMVGQNAQTSTPAQSAQQASAPQTNQGDIQRTVSQPGTQQQADTNEAFEAQTPQGTITMQEMVMQQYFNSLASEEKYAPIAEEIRNGAIFKEMKAMGSNPFEANGGINEGRLRSFLDMYAKTKPATPPTNPEAGGNTVAYTKVENGQITSDEMARKILSEEGHPNHQQAVDYFRNKLYPQQKQS